MSEGVLGRLRAAGAVAILRAADASRFADVAAVLIEEGLDAVELTLSSAGALDAIAAARAAHPRAAIGAGTVLDAAAADAAIDAGAAYLLAPHLALDVLERGRARGVPVVPGAATPTEIVAAHRAGAEAVKVFPIAELGGIAYIRALRGPLPGIPLAPTGGIAVDDVEGYLRAGCVFVGLGSPLVGDAATGGSLDALRTRARRVRAGVARARAG